MVRIDSERCTGCGLCVKDCIRQVLSVRDGKAQAAGECILCGHCVALCPQNAVSIPEYDMPDVEACTPQDVALDAGKLLRAIKFRRSVRDYQPRAVAWELLEPVLQAGRYTATAKNRQGCRFIAVQKDLDTLKEKIWSGIGEALAHPEEPENQWAREYRRFDRMRRQEPEADYLFRNAPAVLFVAADTGIDAGLAAQNMELEAVALGLGMLYNGYLCRAAGAIPAVREWLGAGDKTLFVCTLLGHPAVTYRRTAPRRAGDFIIK